MTSILNRVWRPSQPANPVEKPSSKPGFTPINVQTKSPPVPQDQDKEESLFVSPGLPPMHEGNYIRTMEPGMGRASSGKGLPTPAKRVLTPNTSKFKATPDSQVRKALFAKDKTPKASSQPTSRGSFNSGSPAKSAKRNVPVSTLPAKQSITSLNSFYPGPQAVQSSPPRPGVRESIELDMATSDDEQSESKAEDNDNASTGSENESEAPEGVFEVEAILNHELVQRKINLLVKWTGYGEDDNTWEPESNLEETAAEILQSYYNSIGGRPQIKANSGRRRKVVTENTKPLSPEYVDAEEVPKTYYVPTPSPRLETPQPWAPEPPEKGNWEELIVRIETLYKLDDHVVAYIIWVVEDEYGEKHKNRQDYWAVRLAAPNALLKYYESHVDFEGTAGGGIPMSAKTRPKPRTNAPQADMVGESGSKKRKLQSNVSSTALPSRMKKVK